MMGNYFGINGRRGQQNDAAHAEENNIFEMVPLPVDVIDYDANEVEEVK